MFTNTRWIDNLDKFIEIRNNSFHSNIKMKKPHKMMKASSYHDGENRQILQSFENKQIMNNGYPKSVFGDLG